MRSALNSHGEPRGPGSLRRPTAVSGSAGPRPHLRQLGHLSPVVKSGLIESYLGWAEEVQDDYVVWLGPKAHVVVVRPESVRRVLTDEAHFLRNVRPTRPLFGHGILRLEGET